MNKIKAIILSFCLPLILFGQEDIQYQHRLVQKTLEKSFNTNNIFLLEMPTKDSYYNGKYFIASDNQKTLGYVYIGRVNSCRAGGCSLNNTSEAVFEYFDYMMIFNFDQTVKMVKVFNYKATYGQEICSKNWLKQFIGFTGSTKLSVGNEIDAISGATTSVQTITWDIQDKTNLLKYILQNRIEP